MDSFTQIPVKAQARSLLAEKARDNAILVHFLNVGQEDCVLIQEPGGHNVLIDTKNRTVGDQYISEYLDIFIDQDKNQTLDLVAVTHPHADHGRGILAIVNHFNIRVQNKVWVTHYNPFQKQPSKSSSQPPREEESRSQLEPSLEELERQKNIMNTMETRRKRGTEQSYRSGE